MSNVLAATDRAGWLLTDERPTVSVIVPMLNEINYIDACIDGINRQTYPADLIEILIVDGGSTDGSRERVQERLAGDDRIRLIENPRVVAAAAANEGIGAATTDVLCFISAHGVPDANYIELSVDALVETKAVGVGGRYRHEGLDPRATGIGLAMASPFGMASPHRSADERIEVDTISHPVFLRQPLVDVGGYDEALLRNEDYELNYRLRKAGGSLVFTPEISTIYRPRRSVRELAVQFYAYGLGKAAVLRKHPESLQARHLVPPVAVASLFAAPLVWWLVPSGWVPVLVGAAGYLAVLATPLQLAKPGRHSASALSFLAALPTMHVSWGLGVLVGGVRQLLRGRGPRS